MDGKLAMLQQVPLFAGLGRNELGLVSRLCDEVDLPAGRELIREGTTGNEFFMILEGSVQVERDGAVLGTLGPGDYLGEIALIDHGPRSATAICETACRLLVLGHREFHSLLDANAEIRSRILQTLAARVRRLEPDSTH